MKNPEDTPRSPLPGQRTFWRDNRGKFGPKPVERPVKRTESVNSWLCPKCNAATRVTCSRPPFRYRQCMTCRHNYRTQEVIQAHADALLGLVRTTIRELEAIGVKPGSTDS